MLFADEERLNILFTLQCHLIEHKYPIVGIWEHLISHAGDVYRGLCGGKREASYINSKLSSLKRYMYSNALNNADFRDFKYYSEGEYYRKSGDKDYSPQKILSKKKRFMCNLETLRNATLRTDMSSTRKEAMLDALDMIKELALYYEKTPLQVPTNHFVQLQNSIENYLEPK